MVFFSTTQFLSFSLGPIWRKLFGVPYIVNFQDPWVSSYYNIHGITPPGGEFRYSLMQKLGNFLEPISLSLGSLVEFSDRSAGDELGERIKEILLELRSGNIQIGLCDLPEAYSDQAMTKRLCEFFHLQLDQVL